MKNFNLSGNKFLSILFIFLLVGLTQTVSAQSHVIILKGHQNPPNEAQLVCLDKGGVFDIDIYNFGKKTMTNLTVTITMIDAGGNSSISSVSSLGILNPNLSGGVSFNVPSNYPYATGHFVIEVSYSYEGKYVTEEQIVPFDFNCDSLD